ncbi:hypothetical protein PENTCL1PPCAC_8186, partial [Pristionchus entomophagus]
TWTPYKNDDGSWSFLSFHGQWLSANSGADGTVRISKKFGSTERFTIERCGVPWKAYRQAGELRYICGNFRYFSEKERIVSHFCE